MRIRSMAVVVAVPVVFGLAACGGKAGDDGIASAVGGTAKQSASASPSQTLNPQDAALKFAQCMRQNGVDIPDPSADGRFQIRAKPGNQAKVQAAMKKCQHFMKAGGRLGNPDDPKVRDRMLKFAQCMRQHGIDVPDPRPGQGIQLRVNRGSEAKFRAAQEACRQYAPGGGDKGTTSVGGGK
ncbi:MAG TPA: hypothetical protein VE465_24470 [Streptosporangiaceae bacterium]|jgi:hypothetical protein|nr:hypothetical protein [Streptosporangiaceae bacterium]